MENRIDGEWLNFAAGKVILFTSGQYSDYGTCGCVVTLKPCNLVALGNKYKMETPVDKRGDSETSPEGFPTWLVVNGYAMPAEIDEVHCGSYGEFEL